MAQYVKRFGGYIADVPNFWFRRCDGKVFYFDELTNASVAPQIGVTEVNAGWSLFPVATLPGQSTFEVSLTSGKFEAEMFSMANATDFEENAEYAVPQSEYVTLDGEKKAVLTQTPIEGSIVIEGLTAEDYTVSEKTITFTEAQDSPILVNYEYNQTAREALITNQNSAIGEAIMVYPVYGSGDDCTQSAIIGKVILKVYKARVSGQPGLNGSYKSASTFDMTLTALDAKRPDGAAYSIAYVQNA